VKLAMPASDPMMSIAYAFNGGMLLSSGPSGSARVASSATTSETTSGRIRKFWSAAWLSARPKKSSFSEWIWTFSCMLKMNATMTARSSAKGEMRGLKRVAADQDAQADAQERGDQQEVAEKADVLDVRRNPADEQQLDEQDREAGQE